MTMGRSNLQRWKSWSIEIKVWKLLIGFVIASILLMWYGVVHQDDEILALIRNDVVARETDHRTWVGSFVNTNDRVLRDVAVTVDFLDAHNRTVGAVDAAAAEMPFRTRLDLQAPLPATAARIRIHSVQWRMGTRAALMGPFREPWEFGYLMIAPAEISP